MSGKILVSLKYPEKKLKRHQFLKRWKSQEKSQAARKKILKVRKCQVKILGRLKLPVKKYKTWGKILGSLYCSLKKNLQRWEISNCWKTKKQTDLHIHPNWWRSHPRWFHYKHKPHYPPATDPESSIAVYSIWTKRAHFSSEFSRSWINNKQKVSNRILLSNRTTKKKNTPEPIIFEIIAAINKTL